MAELGIDALRDMAERATNLTSAAREEAEGARDYYDGYQWTDGQIATLKKRKQPVLTLNHIRRKVDAMVGMEQRGRIDPKALPRTPQDEQAADIATKALVYVDDVTRFDRVRTQAFENLLVEGYGGAEIGVEQIMGRQGPEMQVTVTPLRWEEVFYDPFSRQKDFSDAQFVGVMKWMDLDQALATYGDDPETAAALEEVMHNTSDGETYEDRPQRQNFGGWVDRRQKRVRVAQMYYRRGGEWYLAVFTGQAVLHSGVSPYQEAGESACPMILMTAYVDRENRRYGVIRDMISPQDEINHRRSKALHMLNSRQTIGAKAAVDSVAGMKRELAAPDGHVEVEAGPGERIDDVFRVVPQTDQLAGQFQLLQEAKQELDLVGPNAALQGSVSGGQSGRAILAQQQAGMSELAPIYDSLNDWTIRCYRAMWARIQQFWTAPKWIRVTDNEQAQFMFLNQPVAAGPMGVVYQNRPADMDVDIIVDSAPDVAALQHEQFEQLSQMAQAGVPIPPDVLIEASSLHDKQKLLSKMRGEGDEQQAQARAAQMELEQRAALAKLAETESKAAKNMAGAQKDQADAFATMQDAGFRAGVV